MAGFTGGCLCGAVRYEVSGDPIRVANCHCDDCRKVTGAAFATNVFVKEDDLTIQSGDLGSYSHQSDSGNTMTKKFCSNCGSQVFSEGTGSPGAVGIKVGSIDDASNIKPQITVYAARALPFVQIDEDTEIFQEMRSK